MMARQNERDGKTPKHGRAAGAGAGRIPSADGGAEAPDATPDLAPDRAGYVFGGAAAALLLLILVHPNRAQPGIHLVVYVIWIALGAVFFIQALAMRPRAGARFLGSAGALAAGLFGLWTLGRWWTMRLYAPGGSVYVETPWAGASAVASALSILPSMLMAAGVALIPTDSGGAIAARTLRRALVLSIFGFAAHALYQRFVGYEAQLRDLKEALASTQTMTPLMAQSMIHALEEKRVGGPFGNANLLAAFIAVLTAFVPSLWVDRIGGRKWAGPALAVAAAAAGLATVLLTGSRGGALSWIFGLSAGILAACMAGGGSGFPGARLLAARRTSGPAATLLVALALAAVVRAAAAGGHEEHAARVEARANLFDRLSRIDTIRERLFYWTVAMRVWEKAPIIGQGPGSFELRYPGLKPPKARESRYAHSWIFQIGSETGLMGLALFGAILASAGVAAGRAWVRVHDDTLGEAPPAGTANGKNPSPAEILFFAAAAATLVFNGLFEYSLQAREFMILLAALLGVVLGLGGLDENQPDRPLIKQPGVLRAIISVVAALMLVIKANSRPIDIGGGTLLGAIGLYAALFGSAAWAASRWTRGRGEADSKRVQIRFLLVAAVALFLIGYFGFAREEREISYGPREFILFLAAVIGAMLSLAQAMQHIETDPFLWPPNPEPGRFAAIFGGLLSVLTIAAGLTLTTKLQMSTLWEWRGRLAAQEGQHAEAAQHFERALRWTPDNDAYLASRAMALYANDPRNPNPALALLSRAEKINPLSAKLLQSEAEILVRTNELKSAGFQLDHAAGLYPNDAGVRLDRAELNLKRGNTDAAREDVLYIRDAALPVWEYQQPALDSLMKRLGIK